MLHKNHARMIELIVFRFWHWHIFLRIAMQSEVKVSRLRAFQEDNSECRLAS